MTVRLGKLADGLKPCPFCGTKADTLQLSIDVDSHGCCIICYEAGDDCYAQGPFADTVSEAIEFWNKRAEAK